MDHKAEAERLMAGESADKTGEAYYVNDSLAALLAANAHALLDVADAIREQTAAFDIGGVRDDLGDLRAVIEKYGNLR